MVCNMLDRLPVRYIALDSSPGIAIEARGKGLPVFYGMLQLLTDYHNIGVEYLTGYTVSNCSLSLLKSLRRH